MSNKKLLVSLAAMIMVISLGACTQSSSSQESTGESSSILSVSTDPSAPFATVTDHAGREVVIKTAPEKIVSGYYLSSSMLIGLGLGEKVVGIEAKANTRPIYSLAYPSFIDLPNVGSAKEFNLEGTAALTPDLVILPIKLKDAATALTELGINVILINPENDDLLYETLTMIGNATGTLPRAEEMIKYSKEKTAELGALLADEKPVSVYIGSNSSIISTAGSKMYQNQLLMNSNCTNVASSIEDSYWAEISYEQLIKWNPDVIVIVPGATYTIEDVLGDSSLSALTAVKNKAVYAMPHTVEAWDSPLVSSYLGSMWIASVVHPDKINYDDFVTAAADYYKTYYNFDVTPALALK